LKVIEDYFSSVDKFLAKQMVVSKIEPQNLFRRISNTKGRIEARIYFFDGSYLDVGEMVAIERGVPLNYHYRYHYQRPEGPVFTYDDAPDHRELETFPYHKHTYTKDMRETEPHQKVTLTDVVKEIATLLQE